MNALFWHWVQTAKQMTIGSVKIVVVICRCLTVLQSALERAYTAFERDYFGAGHSDRRPVLVVDAALGKLTIKVEIVVKTERFALFTESVLAFYHFYG